MDGLYRRNGKNIYIKQPLFNELSYVKELWADRDTMRDLGGVFDFNESKWESFYKKMVSPSDGKNFYCLIYDNLDNPIGEVSFHGYDAITKIARFNIKIQAKYRRQGYGREAANLLLEYYFLEFGGDMIMDHISNEVGIILASKMGFEEAMKNSSSVTFRMKREEFQNFEKGLEASIEILGINKVDILEYTLPFEIFTLSNKILSRKLFKINSINFSESVKSDCELEIIYKSEKKESDLNVLIIPGGSYYKADDIEKFKYYIIDNYDKYDYVCAFNEGIDLLITCKTLSGIIAPNGEWVKNLKETEKSGIRIIDENYSDNGKLMLSSNMIGSIELYLDLVKKIAGKDLESKLRNKIGLK